MHHDGMGESDCCMRKATGGARQQIPPPTHQGRKEGPSFHEQCARRQGRPSSSLVHISHHKNRDRHTPHHTHPSCWMRMWDLGGWHQGFVTFLPRRGERRRGGRTILDRSECSSTLTLIPVSVVRAMRTPRRHASWDVPHASSNISVIHQP